MMSTPVHPLEDELTGLQSRRSFMHQLRRQVTLANDTQSILALIVIDVDGFSAINAANGFEFGDKLLLHVAGLLREVARPHDYIARLGGDRFALMLPRIMNKGHAELAVQKLLRLLDTPFEHGEHRIKIALTAGVALCPQHSTHSDFLFRLAERALSEARATGERFGFAADHGLGQDLSQFWDLELELAGAIDRSELSLHYQPKARCSDLSPLGAEALMRWYTRSRGEVAPSTFVPVAERTGQIKALTFWAINTALRQASAWKHAVGDLSIAVNIPPEMVTQPDLPDLVENALRLWRRDGVNLTLEITERSLVIEPKQTFRILSQIRAMGVRISLDDFGTGYSCLAYFRDIPADEIKIDRSFISTLLKDKTSAAISSLIVDMAHRFGLGVVAEGVEDEATFEAVRAMGCDSVQGFWLSKGMPSEEFEQWLVEPKSLATAADPLPFGNFDDVWARFTGS
jgi:diguanylate cyclase (GGDEF)-like protein